jgi:hypothetical protein
VEKPLCKLCQHRHYPSEDHVWKDQAQGALKAKERLSPTVTVPPVAIPSPSIHSVTKAATESSAADARFDRKTYQREYMREYMKRRRAK